MKKYILILLILSSCNIRQKITDYRANNKTEWLKKKGYLSQSADTIIRTDTIKGWNFDTVVIFDSSHITDTLTMLNGPDSVITIVKWKERIIRQIKTERDTILRDTTITNTKVVTKKEVIYPKWYEKLWWLWIIVTLVGIILFRILMDGILKRMNNQ